MLSLPKSNNAFGSDDFKAVLKGELEALSSDKLPLQKGLSQSSYVSGDDFTITMLSITDTAEQITVKVGVFYAGIIAGCNCSDDPTPVDEINEYCELELIINKNSAAADVRLLS
ncbi:MAG: hypothetical protein GY934_16180 [Gammaproteobacteria bacterium]|nr:hypothetical protein [Gammaproteobacteria bacterium]